MPDEETADGDNGSEAGLGGAARPTALTYGLLTFIVSTAVLAAFFLQLPVLYDTDSYYHLAVARTYQESGILDEFPWARMSLFSDGFGDKEVLFHLLLAPFADGRSSTGGRLALAVLGAGLTAAVVAIAVGAVGRWALLCPLLLWLGSADFVSRAIRLRPELWAALLVLSATWAAARKRWIVLGLLACVYSLSYTAVHALVGLAGLWWWQQGWHRGRWEPRLLLYPVAGVVAGLVLHPHFPHNLLIWKVQSVDYFLLKDTLDVGTEIRPPKVKELLWDNLGWLFSLAVLWRSGVPQHRNSGTHPPVGTTLAADLLAVTALAYGLLYLIMWRFSTYAVPFLTLAVLWQLRHRGRQPGLWVPLPGRGRVPTLVILAVVLAFAAPARFRLAFGLSNAHGPIDREVEWAAFGDAVPEGARVAASWGSTHLYYFWAPQGRYLNVLDPIFMALPYPEEHALLGRVLTGDEPDLPLALVGGLNSDYLATSAFSSPDLLRRLRADPRLVELYAAYNLLFRVEAATRAFVRNWQASPGRHHPTSAPEIAEWRPYPRSQEPRQATVEAFVDGARVAGDVPCRTFARSIAAGPARRLELASWGPASLWLNGELVVASGGNRAVLGDGIHIEMKPTVEDGLLSVISCRGDGGRSGFYLLDRSLSAAKAENQVP